MDQTVYRKLVVRLAALVAISFSLILILRDDRQVGLSMAQQLMPSFQAPAPVIVANNQPGSPLVISGEHQLAKTEQAPEIAFNVTNVTHKTITAFAIKMEVAAGPNVVTEVTLINLGLSASDLPPNRAFSSFDTYENLSSEKHRITLSVDYVQFSDGKRWGVDSVKSSEQVAGNRAAIEAITTRLPGIIRDANANELVSILESMANIDPPPQQSEEWNSGFRGGARSFTNRLKRANQAGGLAQVNTELAKFISKRAGDH